MDEENRKIVMQVLDYFDPAPRHRQSVGNEYCGMAWRWTEPTCPWCGTQESRTGMIDRILNGEVEYPLHYSVDEYKKLGYSKDKEQRG